MAVALGSNLGDRAALVAEATSRLSTILTDLRASSVHDTAPVGVQGPQPNYLNAVVVGDTMCSARDLLVALMDIERTMGRTRPYHAAPRIIDLDLILYGEAIIDEPGLTVPHPRFRDRRFVLAPLCEIAPEMVDPVTGMTARALLDAL